MAYARYLLEILHLAYLVHLLHAAQLRSKIHKSFGCNCNNNQFWQFANVAYIIHWFETDIHSDTSTYLSLYGFDFDFDFSLWKYHWHFTCLLLLMMMMIVVDLAKL